MKDKQTSRILMEVVMFIQRCRFNFIVILEAVLSLHCIALYLKNQRRSTAKSCALKQTLISSRLRAKISGKRLRSQTLACFPILYLWILIVSPSDHTLSAVSKVVRRALRYPLSSSILNGFKESSMGRNITKQIRVYMYRKSWSRRKRAETHTSSGAGVAPTT